MSLVAWMRKWMPEEKPQFPEFGKRTAWIRQYKGGSMSCLVMWDEAEVERTRRIDDIDGDGQRSRILRVTIEEAGDE